MLLLLVLCAEVFPVQVEDRTNWNQVYTEESEDVNAVHEEVVFASPYLNCYTFVDNHEVDT